MSTTTPAAGPAVPGVCDHCGRQDLGSAQAGKAAVSVVLRDPYTNRATGSIRLAVCYPTVADRPFCYGLVNLYAAHGHGRNCEICHRENPPGRDAGPTRPRAAWRPR